jgi:toxin ParE1/3/4
VAHIYLRAKARQDILDSADYLEREASLALAEHFIEATRQSFETLAQMPRAGALCGFTSPRTRRLRRWPVSGFENWLIFYLPKKNGVEIVHVMHGSRNLFELF